LAEDDAMTDREAYIVEDWNAAIANMKASNRKADRRHAEGMARRRDAGALPRLAHLVVLIEDVFGEHDVDLVGVSERTFSRYYGQHFITEPVIRVSDHDTEDWKKLHVDLIIHEDMTEDDARQKAADAVRSLEQLLDSVF
jgi:hypothetical protein